MKTCIKGSPKSFCSTPEEVDRVSKLIVHTNTVSNFLFACRALDNLLSEKGKDAFVLKEACKLITPTGKPCENARIAKKLHPVVSDAINTLKSRRR